jgi:hypothetical protein
MVVIVDGWSPICRLKKGLREPWVGLKIGWSGNKKLLTAKSKERAPEGQRKTFTTGDTETTEKTVVME